MRAIRAMGQLLMAGSASRRALALFWTAERSPGVSESLAKGALGVFSRRRRSSTVRAPAFSSLKSSSTAPCAVIFGYLAFVKFV